MQAAFKEAMMSILTRQPLPLNEYGRGRSTVIPDLLIDPPVLIADLDH